jgi:chorismate lyase/3-hydroxybenzoate synthase
MTTRAAARTVFSLNSDKSISCGPQSWAREMVEDSSEEEICRCNSGRVRRSVGREFTLVSAEVPEACNLDSRDFQHCVESTYASVLKAVGHRRVVRLWNFIPGILDPIDKFDQRYKVFNMGRFNSFTRWFGGTGKFGHQIATASGVGTTSGRLAVHALATSKPAEPVENPRQIPSYRYSRDYGPLPPCFARAMRVTADTERLLVGGTASIRGEETVHTGSLTQQLDETILNLAAIVGAGLGMVNVDCNFDEHNAHLLARYRDLRVYCPDPQHLDLVASRVEAAFHGARRIEFVQAELCRPGLLVEIEGWADLKAVGIL